MSSKEWQIFTLFKSGQNTTNFTISHYKRSLNYNKLVVLLHQFGSNFSLISIMSTYEEICVKTVIMPLKRTYFSTIVWPFWYSMIKFKSKATFAPKVRIVNSKEKWIQFSITNIIYLFLLTCALLFAPIYIAMCSSNFITAQFTGFRLLSGNGAKFLYLARPKICPVSVVSTLQKNIYNILSVDKERCHGCVTVIWM